MGISFDNLPCDIKNLIFTARINSMKDDKYKRQHNLMIKHLELYFEEMIDQDDDAIPDLNVKFIKDGDIRCDAQFVEYEETTRSLRNIIYDKHGGEDCFYEWMDESF